MRCREEKLRKLKELEYSSYGKKEAYRKKI